MQPFFSFFTWFWGCPVLGLVGNRHFEVNTAGLISLAPRTWSLTGGPSKKGHDLQDMIFIWFQENLQEIPKNSANKLFSCRLSGNPPLWMRCSGGGRPERAPPEPAGPGRPARRATAGAASGPARRRGNESWCSNALYVNYLGSGNGCLKLKCVWVGVGWLVGWVGGWLVE